MTAFFAAFNQFFAAVTTFFSALEKSAKAVDHLAGWAEQSAGAFADEATNTRQVALDNMLTAANKSKAANKASV